MDISQMNENQFADLFGMGSNAATVAPQFGMQETNTDLFQASVTDTTTLPSSTSETTTLPSSTTDTTTLAEADIFDDEEGAEGKQGAESTTGLTDYFKSGLEKGLFTPIKVQTETGEEVDFIPTTPEEFDEVLEMQINYQVEQKAKEVEEKFYAEKSPAWRALLQYAEMVDNPAEVLPFLQGINKIQSVAEINEEEIDGAETIIRIQLEKSGQPQEIIDTQIEALKTTNKLVETAQKLKPAILQEETQRLAQMKQEEERRLNDYRKMVIEIRDSAINAIEAPIGKQPLRQEEKAAIYELIAVPSEQSQGYPIYNKIDELFEKKDFETLKQVALFLTHKDSFINYISSQAKEQTATGLQRKLRLASEKSTGTKDPEIVEKPVIRRQTQSSGKPGFGRG